MRRNWFLSIVVVVLLFVGVSGVTARHGVTVPAAPQAAAGSGFTFQGQLKNAGATVNGNCDMTFGLFDDAASGAQIGSVITATVPVTNSLFTVMLNTSGEFGANAFNGDARWLQVAVKCAGDAALTTLSPRQQITAAPYAQYSMAGSNVVKSTWIQQSPRNTPPEARHSEGAYAYDSINDRLIFYGGGNATTWLTDVWILENASGVGGTSGWMQLSPAGGPPPLRGYGTTVFDPTSNRLIVHGGCAGFCSPALADTWVLTNANGLGGTPGWQQLPDAPIARASHTAVYDSGSNRMIIFGGNQAWYGTNLNDVWVLTNANGIGSPSWIQLSPTGTPPAPRENAEAIYDPATNRMIVFGGEQTQTGPIFTLFNDVWILTNANGLGGTPQWIQLMPGGGPPPSRQLSSVAYDPATNRLIVSGGESYNPPVETFYDDVWILTEANGIAGSPQWIKLTPNGNLPAPYYGTPVAYSMSTNRMIMAMVRTEQGFSNEVWLLTNANGLTR